jgi:hypothetical protein
MTTTPRTPQPLTDEQLAEIQARIPVVYEGPWDFEWDDSDTGQPDCWVVSYSSDHPLAGLVAEVPDYGAELAEFIAHARTDVPALLAEVDRLRAALDAQRSRTVDAVNHLRRAQPLESNLAAVSRLQLIEQILTGAPAPEHHVVDGVRYLCDVGDHYCQRTEEAAS